MPALHGLLAEESSSGPHLLVLTDTSGDADTPQANGTEMSRIRSMLGDAVESNPYRLFAGLAGSVQLTPVLGMLRHGQVVEARWRRRGLPCSAARVPWPFSCSGISRLLLLDPPCGPAAMPDSWSVGSPRIWAPWISKPSKRWDGS